MRFVLQNRYQDSGWMWLDEEFDDESEAILTAASLSCDSICYGMVRVIDREKCEVVTTFPAGAPHVEEDH